MELERIQDEARQKCDGATERAETEVAAIEEELRLLREKSDKDFEREQLEFDYNLKRERKTMQEKRNEVITEREDALKQREAEARDQKEACEKRLNEIEALEEEVADIPARIEAAKQEGAAEKEKLLNKEFKYRTELENKTEELKISALQGEYDRISEKLAALKEETANLSKRLDQCNMESRKLTSDTVRFIGGINILNSDTHPYAEANVKNK